ncbi:glycoside hydrolase family 15 protein, partial [Streptomyces sp. SID8455]|nr:glycoside hydrolase family 15 protein [Streptomyces sp. SID8455]
EVCEKGYDPVRNTFTQSYGSRELDAATLLIVRTGFLPPDDPRVVGTVDAVRAELGSDGLVRRYSTEGGSVDGLPGDEGAFL